MNGRRGGPGLLGNPSRLDVLSLTRPAAVVFSVQEFASMSMRQPTPGAPFQDRVLVGDCLEVLAQLPAASVDLVFADPPYNLQLERDLRRPNDTLVDGVDEDWDKFASFADYDRFSRAWLAECRRALKPDGCRTFAAGASPMRMRR